MRYCSHLCCSCSGAKSFRARANADAFQQAIMPCLQKNKESNLPLAVQTLGGMLSGPCLA